MPLAIVDTDHDGRDEIFLIQESFNRDFNEIFRYTISDDETELIPEKVTVPGISGGVIQAIRLADINGDHIFEMILLTLESNSVIFLSPVSLTEYQIFKKFTLNDTLAGNTALAFRVGDADVDGVDDLVVVPFDGSVRLYSTNAENELDFVFIGKMELQAIIDDTEISDLDKDGISDLIYVSRGTGIYGVEQISVVCGLAPGEFSSVVTFESDRSTSEFGVFSDLRIEAIDIDNDGREDFVFLDDVSEEMLLFLNHSVDPLEPTQAPTPISKEFHFTSLPVGGFEPAQSVESGPVPIDNTYPGATDGEGTRVTLRPGQGVFLLADTPEQIEGSLVELTVAARVDSDLAQLALIAFADPISTDYGYVNPIKSEVPVDRWGELRLVYDSPSSAIIPALQFVVPSGAPEGEYTIYFDSLRIAPFIDQTITPLTLMADPTFDTIAPPMSELNPNAFLPQGEVPGTVSLVNGMSGQGVELAIAPNQLAAHTAVFSIAPPLPAMIHSSVYIKRASGAAGTIALVLTDGEQSVGYFIHASHLPEEEFYPIRLGGNFTTSGKSVPPICVIQLGGPGVTGKITIDQLDVFTTE